MKTKEELKNYILANYPNVKNGDQLELQDMFAHTYNEHYKVEDIYDCIYEILNPPPPSIEELEVMKVAELDSVIDKYNLEVDKSLLKADKLQAIIDIFYPQLINTEENEESIN